MPNNQSNQTEAEFFALVATGTKSVESIFSNYGKKIMQRSAPNLRDDSAFEVWGARVIFEIASDDKLMPLLNTKKGVVSAYRAINQAAIDGLQIGGAKPQTYFVPRGGEICLDIADRGMEFVCVYGPGAVLTQVPQLVKIYDGDDVRVDEAEGRILYPKGEGKKIFGNGKLIGYAMELEYKDGRRQVERITLEKCRQIEERYGQKGSPLYAKSPEEADEKTARKQMLKRAFAESEGRAMALALTDAPMQEIPREIDDPPPRDVSDRMAAHLDRKAERSAAVEAAQDAEVVEGEPETEQAKGDEAPAQNADGTLDIF
jgi:recombinational DNA repair protein RecT